MFKIVVTRKLCLYNSLPRTFRVLKYDFYDFRYQLPQMSSQIDVKLHPFIPEYYPSVGDIDAFIKVHTTYLVIEFQNGFLFHEIRN